MRRSINRLLSLYIRIAPLAGIVGLYLWMLRLVDTYLHHSRLEYTDVLILIGSLVVTIHPIYLVIKSMVESANTNRRATERFEEIIATLDARAARARRAADLRELADVEATEHPPHIHGLLKVYTDTQRTADELEANLYSFLNIRPGETPGGGRADFIGIHYVDAMYQFMIECLHNVPAGSLYVSTAMYEMGSNDGKDPRYLYYYRLLYGRLKAGELDVFRLYYIMAAPEQRTEFEASAIRGDIIEGARQGVQIKMTFLDRPGYVLRKDFAMIFVPRELAPDGAAQSNPRNDGVTQLLEVIGRDPDKYVLSGFMVWRTTGPMLHNIDAVQVYRPSAPVRWELAQMFVNDWKRASRFDNAGPGRE